MDVDLVMTYVDQSRQEWQDLYRKTCRQYGRKKIEPQRYRVNTPLKYMLRAIDKNCPFIRTVYLIVQSRDQVPEYVKESEKLKIILHSDIMPKDILPTYNSNSIEAYMYNIPGLSEQFIYTNDDMYPCLPMKEEDFFDEKGLPKIDIQFKRQEPNMYRNFLKNAEIMVKDILGIKGIISNIVYYRDGHSWMPMLKSVWNTLHSLKGSAIKRRSSQFREWKNLCPQLGTYYSYFSGNYAQRTIKTKYFELKSNLEELKEAMNEYSIICINDASVKVDSDKINTLNTFFEERYPNKSDKYEQ